MWVNQLFVENRTIFLKWMNSQDKKDKPEELKQKLEESGHDLVKLIDKNHEGDLMEVILGVPQETLQSLVLQIRTIIINFDLVEPENESQN